MWMHPSSLSLSLVSIPHTHTRIKNTQLSIRSSRFSCMSTQGASSSSPSSSSTTRWKFDIFLSFRGVDTRKGFTDHLYAALQQKGILTFRDDEELERGKSISPELLKAIEESQFAIVILSKNYASSTWCLDELAKIVRCMKDTGLTVFPVFYGVDPSDVRTQTSTFEKSFVEHEECYKEKIKKVETWRAALSEVANLSRWHLQERPESKLIQEIVKEILHKLSSSFSSITNDFVGIDSSVEELITSYLGLGNNVGMIGICGMGGLGKTTLARVVYDKFSNQFEGSSFVANVREVSKKYGLVQLQKQLLTEILEERNIDIWNTYYGVDMIKNRLRQKKVLLVLDDVNELDQLESLAGEHDWFGLGSWIIITTRDKHLLCQHGVHKIYKLGALNGHDALKLFCLKAFKNEQPKEGYVELSKTILHYAKGLPLALVTLGSFLVGRTIDEWQSALASFKKIPKREIFDILKVSFDGLEEMWKEIFLDIACFFSGKSKDHVIKILEKCGFDATIGIRVLIDNSLLTIEKENLWMHSLLQDMGREIVCQDPRKCNRLWEHEDLSLVLAKHTAPEKIQAVMVNISEVERKGMKFEAFTKVFSKMCNLRLLIIHYEHIPNNSNHDLNFFELFGYSPNCLTSSFQPKELVERDLWSSKIKYIWEGVKYLYKLKCINLCLKEPVDHGSNGWHTVVPKGQYGCIDLVEIHPSIGRLSRLFVLEEEERRYRLLPRRCTSRCLTDHHLPRLPPKAGSIRSNCLKELVLSGMYQLVGIRLNGIGCLSWLKHSTLCFPQGLIYQKLGYESSTGRKEDGSRTAVQIIIPGLEIPRWLSYQRLGNSVSIDLPPNLYNCTWMGFAVCASFNSPPSYDDEFGNPVKTFGLRARVIALGDMPHSHDYASEIFFNVKVAPKHIWLLYLSRDDWLATVDGEYSKIEVVFETYSVNVWKCGAGLLYEQDIEEFHKTCAQCGGSNIITYEGWDGVHYEFENSLDHCSKDFAKVDGSLSNQSLFESRFHRDKLKIS